jgi:Acyl-CoA thioester hydrolase/BAAT N-terminal region
MKLSVEPGDARVDMPLSLRVSDAGPRADVTLTVETTDAGGERWRSQAVYRADAAGAVDVARSPALSGTYKGVDGQGPLWSMRFAGAKGSVPRAFQFPATDLCLAVRADSGPGEDAGATVTRRVTAPSVTRTQHAGDGFAAVVFAPAGTGPVPAVAVLPGSTGARAVEPMAAFLASHGFLAMVVAYMEEPGLPPTLREVPLDGVADPGGEHERAERVRADLDAGSAEVSVLHKGSPDVSVTACQRLRLHRQVHQLGWRRCGVHRDDRGFLRQGDDHRR